jgi:hypothetical protein
MEVPLDTGLDSGFRRNDELPAFCFCPFSLAAEGVLSVNPVFIQLRGDLPCVAE